MPILLIAQVGDNDAKGGRRGREIAPLTTSMRPGRQRLRWRLWLPGRNGGSGTGGGIAAAGRRAVHRGPITQHRLVAAPVLGSRPTLSSTADNALRARQKVQQKWPPRTAFIGGGGVGGGVGGRGGLLLPLAFFWFGRPFVLCCCRGEASLRMAWHVPTVILWCEQSCNGGGWRMRQQGGKVVGAGLLFAVLLLTSGGLWRADSSSMRH
jgi:hypothetical protein